MNEWPLPSQRGIREWTTSRALSRDPMPLRAGDRTRRFVHPTGVVDDPSRPALAPDGPGTTPEKPFDDPGARHPLERHQALEPSPLPMSTVGDCSPSFGLRREARTP